MVLEEPFPAGFEDLGDRLDGAVDIGDGVLGNGDLEFLNLGLLVVVYVDLEHFLPQVVQDARNGMVLAGQEHDLFVQECDFLALAQAELLLPLGDSHVVLFFLQHPIASVLLGLQLLNQLVACLVVLFFCNLGVFLEYFGVQRNLLGVLALQDLQVHLFLQADRQLLVLKDKGHQILPLSLQL